MRTPLLIGGATTSEIHTAVKIEPHYSGTTVHVLDASLSVPMVSNLSSDVNRDKAVIQIRDKYEGLREQHKNRQDEKEILSFEKAQENRPRLSYKGNSYEPKKTGVFAIEPTVEEIRPYIDWDSLLSNLGDEREVSGNPEGCKAGRRSNEAIQ
jgi:5-methyltetrahydrofolate--homocysteine methyltransferase